jgi:Fibronectin type III domain
MFGWGWKVRVALVVVIGVCTPLVSAASAFGSGAQPIATVGMPFTGTWASNALVPPPYTTDSSYPSVAPANNGGDWATDLWAAEGTPITLQVTSADGPVTFTWESSTTSCGTSSKVDVFVNGGFRGWIYFGHLLGGRDTTVADPQPTNGMTLGTVHDFGNGCNDGPHLHIEMSNVSGTSFACWADNGQPGVTLNQGDALGMVGTLNSAAKQSCTPGPPTDGSFVTTPDSRIWQIVGGAPIYVDNWAPFGGPQPTIPVTTLSGFNTYPADGTAFNAQPSGQDWEVVGGATLAVDNWSTLGNPRTFIVNDGALTAAEQLSFGHLRQFPLDGTALNARPSGQGWEVVGGAALAVDNWATLGNPTTTLVVDAALTASTQYSFGHLVQFPADGTVLRAEPSATTWTVNGGCRSAAQSGGVVATDFGVGAIPVCTIPPTAPKAPTGVTATVSGTQASVRWTAPSDNRSPISHYTVTASPGGKTVTVPGTQATIPGLAAGTYTFRVRATNGVGDGPWSSASNAITVATVVASGGSAGGYWMLGANGTVYPFGNAPTLGSANGPVVAITARAGGRGYWTVDAFGDVSHFGTAAGHGGNPPLRAGEMVSTISATPSGNGYWLFTNRGRAFPYGDAHLYGDMSGVALNGPIVASVATPTGHGYYMIGSDGGVFSFGDAQFHGSTGSMRLNQPIVGIAPTPDNRGYWLVASDGGVFAFTAPFRGSMGSVRLNKPVNGLVAYGNGYLMVANDGGVFDFSNKAFVGSLANNPPTAPIIGIAAA